MDEWEVLRRDRPAEALQAMRKVYAEDQKSPFVAIDLGAFYLWLQDWQAAWKHFCNFTEVYPWTTDFAFVFAGTAKWCAGETTDAVVEWKQGIDVMYADAAGGITIPLHLFFAAACQPDLMPMSEAVALLRIRLQRARGTEWPGHLAQLVLEELSYQEALTEGMNAISHLWGERLRQSQEFVKFEIDFWHGVRQLAVGDGSGFFAAMKGCSDFSWDNYDADKELLIDKLRSSEFHLACREAQQA